MKINKKVKIGLSAVAVALIGTLTFVSIRKSRKEAAIAESEIDKTIEELKQSHENLKTLTNLVTALVKISKKEIAIDAELEKIESEKEDSNKEGAVISINKNEEIPIKDE